MDKVLVEDKDILKGLFAQTHLLASLLFVGNDFPGTGEGSVALCRNGTLYMALSQMQGGKVNGSL